MGHLQRLEHIWVDAPIFFITTCTDRRRPLLANEPCAIILIEEWKEAAERHGWWVGRYVIMPDHVHFFCHPGDSAKDLSAWMKLWKEWTSKRLQRVCNIEGTIWQREFFDHLIRSSESYEEKRLYVVENPVRAGLVRTTQEWPWQGEIWDDL